MLFIVFCLESFYSFHRSQFIHVALCHFLFSLGYCIFMYVSSFSYYFFFPKELHFSYLTKLRSCFCLYLKFQFIFERLQSLHMYADPKWFYNEKDFLQYYRVQRTDLIAEKMLQAKKNIFGWILNSRLLTFNHLPYNFQFPLNF